MNALPEHSPFSLPLAFIWPLLRLLGGSQDSIDSGAPNEEALHSQLLNHLLSLSVTGYEQLIAELLQAIGYSHVTVLRDPKRKRRSHKGRNRHGGVDITARNQSGLSLDLVLVQVKQYRRPVSRRFVDELRGAMLRQEGRHALLITTSHFAPVAHKAAQEDHIAPINLIDGSELCRLMVQHQVGVRPGRHGRWEVDRDLFHRLGTRHPCPKPETDKNSRKAGQPVIFQTNNQPNSRAVAGSSNEPTLRKGGEMMGRTHALFGLTSLWLLSGAINQETFLPMLLAAVTGSLLPDLDAAESKLKHLSLAGITPLVPVANALHQSLGHRGLLHSLWGLSIATVVLSMPLGFALGWPAAMELSLGYASHLFSDALTKSGIPLLYPRRRRYHLLPKPWRITTGSLAEETLFPLLATSVLWLLFSHLYFTS